MKMNINEQAAEIHEMNHKWWHDADGNRIERDRGELLMLAISELSEALEGIRKNLMDDHLPHRKMEEVEMADAKIRLLDYAAGFGFRLFSFTAGVPAPAFIENKGDCLLRITWCICQIIFRPHEAEGMVSISIKSIDNYCEKFGLDLDGAMADKLKYNLHRQDHTHEARAAANGKKF